MIKTDDIYLRDYYSPIVLYICMYIFWHISLCQLEGYITTLIKLCFHLPMYTVHPAEQIKCIYLKVMLHLETKLQTLSR